MTLFVNVERTAAYEQPPIATVDETDVDLVVPAAAGTLRLRGAIEARSIVLQTDIVASGREIRLIAEEDIDISGRSIRTSGKAIEITAGEDGRGRLLAGGATIETNKEIELASAGDMVLDGATVSAGSRRSIEADLGRDDATLFVDGTSISGEGDQLAYEPDDVRVVGSPARGRVVSG